MPPPPQTSNAAPNTFYQQQKKLTQQLTAQNPNISMSTKEPASKLLKLRHLPSSINWYNQFIAALDRIIEKKELDIEQLEWVPSFIRSLGELVDFGGKRTTYEGFKNSFWRCIHRVDSLLFQDYEFMKQLRQMLCEARQMLHPDVGKTWEELAEEEANVDGYGKNGLTVQTVDWKEELNKMTNEEYEVSKAMGLASNP